MTIDPTIGSSGSSAISALAAAGGGSVGEAVEDIVRSLATNIVGRIAASLGLTGASQMGQGDIYGLGQLAEGISTSLGDMSATSVGALNRALEDFAGAVASDMAAHADGRTLDLVDGALGSNPFAGAGDVSSVIHGLEQSTAAIERGR